MSKKNLAKAAQRKSRDEARDFRLKRAERAAAEDEAAQAAREGSAIQPLNVAAARERTQAERLAKIEAIAEDRAKQRAGEYISHEEFRSLTQNERKRIRLIGGRMDGARIRRGDTEIKQREIRAVINQYLRDHPAFKKYSGKFITDRLWRFPNTDFPDGIPYAYTKFRKEVGLMLAKIRPLKPRKKPHKRRAR